jgi:hypothetical protein
VRSRPQLRGGHSRRETAQRHGVAGVVEQPADRAPGSARNR